MFLELPHAKPDVFKMSKSFVLSCFKETKAFAPEEEFGIIQQIRRAALSVHLNIVEGCSGKSAAERKGFYEVARGSLVEVDTGLDIAVGLNYTAQNLTELGQLIVRMFQLISKMIS
jgi:four helix bundle protein